MLASIGGGSVKGYQSFMSTGPEGLYTGPWDFTDTNTRTFTGSNAGTQIIGTSVGTQLGNLDDFDLEFEVYSNLSQSSNQWIICNGPYTEPDGILIGIYDNNYEGIAVAGGRIGGYGFNPMIAIPNQTWTHVQLKCRFSSNIASERKIELWQDGVLIGSQDNYPSGTNISFDYLYVGRGASSGGSKSNPTWQQDGLYGSIRNVKIAKRVPFTTTTFPMGHYDTGYTNYTSGSGGFSSGYFGVDIGTEWQLTAGTEIGSKKFTSRSTTTSNHSFWMLVYEHTGGTIATNNQQFTIKAGWRIDVTTSMSGGQTGTNFTTVALDSLVNATGSGYSHPNNFTVPAGKTYYLGWFSGSGGAGYGDGGALYYQGGINPPSYDPDYTPSHISYSGTPSSNQPSLGDVITMNVVGWNINMQMGLKV